MTVGLTYAILVFLVALFSLVIAVIGNRSIRFLRSLPPVERDLPPVSVVAAARNEARGIEKAVRSFLALDYPKLEILVVNDRSEDETGKILSGLQKEFPKLKVIEIRDLPLGWLGKNHALWKGTQETKGEFILFTDGDVVMQPATLSKAMGMVQTDHLDHLAVIPEVPLKGIVLQAFWGYFTILFGSRVRPWKARDPKSSGFIGVGAFNLVRRSSYLRMGTHERIRMRPDDDIKLGQLLKRSGARQDCAFGSGLVEVEWYRSVWELMHGLEKNAFSGFEFRLWEACLATAAIFLVSIGPFVAPWFLSGFASLFTFLAAFLLIATSCYNARVHSVRLVPAFLFPFAALLLVIVLWNGILKTLWKGGIVWRGTFYPLADLRRSVL